ncbi:TonB-dependent receptor [Microbulbifer sp. THAF38]|uniref:TonB-dependent receptor n=1 Tax=Microbulbifer sp. THAF38 TaxID=2587856 RepID=UPI001268DCC8|nr:TonB-dependent receptor [Microbulbifer sp. THAF38]QFT54933.1 Ferrienterobactin receptor precursor [Microbulbifer sp. THAF38]
MKEKTQKENRRTELLRTSASALVLCSVVGMAQAQNTEEAQKESLALEEVEVLGIRQSMEKNLDVKRFSNAVVDSITAEDIGKFPDKNVADALQRVPGVSIVRSGGEGARVSIRGTAPELTFTQLNGNYIATPGDEPSRSLDYSLLPATMIARTDVYKSPEAKLDEGGIGGTVILHTRKPLDLDAGEGMLSVETTYADVTEKYEPQYTGFYSWKNDQETFGVLVGYSRQDRQNRVISTTTENWGWQGDEKPHDGVEARGAMIDIDGNEYRDFYAPRAVVGSVFEEERTREGIQLSAQWRPVEQLELGVNYFRFEQGGNSENYRIVFPEWNYGDAVAPGSLKFDEDGDTLLGMGMLDRGQAELQSPQVAGDYTRAEYVSDTLDFNAIYQGDGYSVRLVVGSTSAEGGPSEKLFASVNSRYGTVADWSWDLSSGTAEIDTSADLGDPNTYPLYDWFSSHWTSSEDDENYYQLDVSIDMDYGWLTSFDVGLKYRDHEINRRITKQSWDDDNLPCPTINWGEVEGACYPWWPDDSFHTDPNGVPDTIDILSSGPLDNIIGGVKVPNFAYLEFEKLKEFLYETYGDPTVIVERDQDYRIGEEVTAAYVQQNFASATLRGNFGVRAVQTKQYARTYDNIDGVLQDEPNIRDSSNTDFLPSANIAWDINDDLVMRAALARVVARVNYDGLGGSESIHAPLPGATVRDGFAGNSELEPYKADQFDLGLEWYFDDASAMGVTLFRKDIASFVINGSSLVTREIDGEIWNVNMSMPVNGTDATAQGAELFVQYAFDNGFGVFANYTYTDTELANLDLESGETIKTEIAGTSKDQYNLSVYYENDLFSVRASYNYRSAYADGYSNGVNTFTDEYDQLDVNASYSLMENLTLTASIINLTEEKVDRYWGEENRVLGSSYSGRRAYMGLTYSF